MGNQIKPMPKLKPVELGQCLNCGTPFQSYTQRVWLGNNDYACERCIRGYNRFLNKREECIKAGNPLLAKALEEATAPEYEPLLKLGVPISE